MKRYPVMYNDFIPIGPKNDPAGTKGKDIMQALKKLAATNGNFVSRCGDKSGTHAAELRYWEAGRCRGRKYIKRQRLQGCGCGMGPR